MMTQFRVLLKIQMTAIGLRFTGKINDKKDRSGFGKTKNSALRAKSSAVKTVGMAILYVIAAVSFMALFGMMFFVIAEPFYIGGLSWLYMTMMMLLCAMFMLIGTVFLAKSQLFEAKDNAQLLPMPIPPQTILLARMATLLIMNLIYGAMVIIPGLICYFWFAGFSLHVLLLTIVLFLALTLFSLAVSCLLGWVLALISARIRNKTFVTVAASLLFIFAYYYFLGQGSTELLQVLVEQSDLVAETLGAVAPLYWIGTAIADAALLPLLGALVVLLVPFAAVYLLLSATFLRTVTVQHGLKKLRYQAKPVKVRKPADALLQRENMHLLSSAVYLLNAGLGVVFLAALSVMALIKFDAVSSVLAMFGHEWISAIVCLAACAMLSMVIFTAPSVSLEAKTLWMLRSMPISSKEILLAKWKLHMVWTVFPTLLISAIGTVFYFQTSTEMLPEILADVYTLSDPPTMVETAISVCTMFLLPQLFSFVTSGIGLLCGLRWPTLNWTNEAQVVKQGFAVVVSMFGNMALAALPAVCIYGLRTTVPVWVMLLLCVGIFATAAVVVYRILTTWGCRTLESLPS